MIVTRAVVPSLFTVLNAFCGFMSIINATQGQIELGAWFIILAAIFDAADGIMARITRSSSQFGVELDSLSDIVSFGVAPSLVVYQAGFFQLGNFGIVLSAMPLIFGAIRLARFNIQLVGFEKDYFKGLPIPMQAITICAFLLEYYSEGHGLAQSSRDLLAILVVVLSLLMVSRVRYDTLPKFSRRDLRVHPWRAILFSVALVLVLISNGRYLFPLLIAFISYGVARAAVEWVRRMTAAENGLEEETEISSIDI
jgi:CDP-diacylglycerol--serine O-phosphatidyltransferase